MKFSPRQSQIITLVGRDGLGYKAVCKELGISMGTLQTQVQRIQRKTRSRKQPRDAMSEAYWRSVSESADTQ